MVDQLHHKWNAERDPQRGSNKAGKQILKQELAQNKVTLKQNKPR
jgi:hypothetical protein